MTEVEIEDGWVADLSQTVAGCAFGQASAALVEQSAVGCVRVDVSGALDELSGWLAGTRGDPGRWPGLVALAPARSKTARHGAILLPFRALLAPMDDR